MVRTIFHRSIDPLLARPLLVASLLSPPLANRFAEVAREIGVDLIRTMSWEEFGLVLQDRPIRIVVVDPCAIQAEEAKVVSLLERYPDPLLIAYTRLTVASVHAIVLLAQKRGVYEVVLHDYDDSALRFRHLLCSIANQFEATQRPV